MNIQDIVDFSQAKTPADRYRPAAEAEASMSLGYSSGFNLGTIGFPPSRRCCTAR